LARFIGMAATEMSQRRHGLHPALETVHLIEDERVPGYSGPDDPPAPLRAACHTTGAVLELTSRALTCKTCRKLAAGERGGVPKYRRRTVSILFSDAEYGWLESRWPAGRDRTERIRRTIFNALEEADINPLGTSKSSHDLPVPHWPYVKACARELRRQDVYVAGVQADSASGVIRLDPDAVPAQLMKDELSLIWTERDGWMFLAHEYGGEEVRMFFGGEVVPEPLAVTRWVRGFLEGKRVSWSDRPPGFGDAAPGSPAVKLGSSLEGKLRTYGPLTDPW
jgi:hypothetical protein